MIWLEKVLNNLDQEIEFERANLLEDIRIGVEQIRKLKVEHAKIKTEVGKTRYSNYTLGCPPDVFVRRALESSDDEETSANGAKGK